MVGKQVIVVGASSGLGAAIALCHTALGDDVFALARRFDRLQMIGASSKGPGRWTSVECDLCAPDSVRIIANLDAKIDLVYVCSAAPEAPSPSDLFLLNTIRPIELAKRFNNPQTRIVLISSLAAIIPFPELAIYCSSKAALEQWVAAYRETSKARILVVRPGQFKSEFFSRSDDFRIDDLPTKRAREVIEKSRNSLRTTITLGGPLDWIAAKLAPIFGGAAIRQTFFPNKEY